MVSAIVLAAGNGTRMGGTVKKQYRMLEGKPLLYYSLHTFCTCGTVDRVILVTGQEDLAYCKETIVEHYHLDRVKACIPGGKERYDSVWEGLQYLKTHGGDPEEIVLIHDGARPLVTADMIERSVATAKEHGACTVGVPVKDTIKVVDASGIGVDTPDRKTLYQIQTPQTFRLELLMCAYGAMQEEKPKNITDDTMLVERYTDTRVMVIQGDYRNLKVTTPEDLLVAEALLRAKSEE